MAVESTSANFDNDDDREEGVDRFTALLIRDSVTLGCLNLTNLTEQERQEAVRAAADLERRKNECSALANPNQALKKILNELVSVLSAIGEKETAEEVEELLPRASQVKQEAEVLLGQEDIDSNDAEAPSTNFDNDDDREEGVDRFTALLVADFAAMFHGITDSSLSEGDRAAMLNSQDVESFLDRANVMKAQQKSLGTRKLLNEVFALVTSSDGMDTSQEKALCLLEKANQSLGDQDIDSGV